MDRFKNRASEEMYLNLTKNARQIFSMDVPFSVKNIGIN